MGVYVSALLCCQFFHTIYCVMVQVWESMMTAKTAIQRMKGTRLGLQTERIQMRIFRYGFVCCCVVFFQLQDKVSSFFKFLSQEMIRRRKQEFSIIEKEIEKKLAEEEERERRNNEEDDEEDEDQTKRRGNERGGGYKGEAQVESQKSGSNLHLSHHGEYGIVDKLLFFRLWGVNFQMESDKRPFLHEGY